MVLNASNSHYNNELRNLSDVIGLDWCGN